jgi:4-carboxymuconolactone decarboxylase
MGAAGKHTIILSDARRGSLAGLRGPGGIRLHSPELSRRRHPANKRLRDPNVIDARTRELAILITAPEYDCQFEWVAPEAEARKEGVSEEIIDTIRYCRATDEVAANDRALIDFGRELFGDHCVTSETFVRLAPFHDKRTLVDLVNLMGMYAMTAASLIAFNAQLPAGVPAGLPSRYKRFSSGSRSTSSAWRTRECEI